MSQTLANLNGKTIFQDYSFPSEKILLKTSAQNTICHVCGRGIEHGRTITAKSIRSEIMFLCDLHYHL